MLNDVMVNRHETRVVHTFNRTDASRYFSILELARAGETANFPDRCQGKREMYFMGKQGEYPNCNKESWTMLYSQCDAALRSCDGATPSRGSRGGAPGTGGDGVARAPGGAPATSCLESGREIHHNQRIDHNLGCLFVNDTLVCVGGMLKRMDQETTVLSAPSRAVCDST